MKALVFVLVLANLLFYAFSIGLIGTADVDEGVRLAQQVQPERINIVARGEPPALPAAPVPVILPEPEPSSEEAVPVAAAASSQPVCLVWEALSQVEAERVSRVVRGGFADFRVQQAAARSEGNGWWVHIPPLANKTIADQKAEELKGLGVTDYFIVPEGANRYAISLGIFSSEKGGKERLAALQTAGVRSARLAQRPGKEGHLRVELRGPADRQDLLRAALEEAIPKNRPTNCK